MAAVLHTKTRMALLFAIAIALLALAAPRASATDPGGVLLDGDSLACIECHDTHASVTGVSATTVNVRRSAASASNHPIGRRYADAFAFGGYRPEASLAREIRLPDGRLSCVSCHLPEGDRHGRLVTSNARSALCLQCHDK